MIKVNLPKKDFIAVYLIVATFYIPFLINRCLLFSNFRFDSQVLLLWKYSAIKNYIPYRDIFYPYGLFSFYKQTNPFLSFIEILIIALLFTIFYKLFKLVYKGYLYPIFAFTIIFVFVNLYTSIEVFARYGIIVAYSSIVSYTIYANHKMGKILHLILGLLAGLIFCLYSDQGILAIIMYAFLLIILTYYDKLVVIQRSYDVKKIIRSLAWFISGFLIIIFPFMLYLFLGNILNAFFYSFVELRNISLYAKIPFPPTIFTVENIFTISIIIAAISYLSYKFLLLRSILKIKDVLVLGIVSSLILLELKNVMRSIDWQISFVAVILFYILISDYIYNNRSRFIKILYFLVTGIFILLFVGFKYVGIYGNLKVFDNKSDKFNAYSCVNETIKSSAENNTFIQVKKEIVKYGGNKKIYSYPSDPVFYILFDQKPPFYPTIYEASFEVGQKRRIEYLKSNNIDFVILNSSILSIQDNIPDYIRAKYELQYILNNYEYLTSVNNFIILKKGFTKDLLTTSEIKQSKYVQSLLRINLGQIPYLEAREKAKYLSDPLMKFVNLDALNVSLSKKNLRSDKKLLLIKLDNDKNTELGIHTRDGLSTKVMLSNCSNLCLINLENIPLFYKVRDIDSITSTEKISGTEIFEEDKSIFW